MPLKASEFLFDLPLVQVYESDKAFLVYDRIEQTASEASWLPKSRSERGDKTAVVGRHSEYRFFMSLWIARQRGWL